MLCRGILRKEHQHGAGGALKRQVLGSAGLGAQLQPGTQAVNDRHKHAYIEQDVSGLVRAMPQPMSTPYSTHHPFSLTVHHRTLRYASVATPYHSSPRS